VTLLIVFVLNNEILMKQFFGLFFSLAILFAPVYNGTVWLNYELNKAAIAEKYCENKAVPESTCEGSCHVQKTLIKQDAPSTSQEEAPSIPSMARAQLFFQDNAISVGTAINCKSITNSPDPLYSFEAVDDIFHPPIS